MMEFQPGLFVLLHDGEGIGTSNLESGDPQERSVSGVFNIVGDASALAGWIASVGGAQDDGVSHLSLDNQFELRTRDGDTVPHGGGTLIAVPADDETFIELTDIPQADYELYFAGHVSALSADSD